MIFSQRSIQILNSWACRMSDCVTLNPTFDVPDKNQIGKLENWKQSRKAIEEHYYYSICLLLLQTTKVAIQFVLSATRGRIYTHTLACA